MNVDDRLEMQLDGFRRPELALIPSADNPYTLYYDETNNIRKLRFTEKGLSSDAFDCFVLGGIALSRGSRIEDITALKQALRIQSTAHEMKLKHVAKGTYEEVLASPRLGIFFKWLQRSQAIIHYSNLSILNWSILDLVESMLAEQRFAELRAIHWELKNELHALVRQDALGYMRLVQDFHYPNVPRDQVGAFIKDVCSYLFSKAHGFRNIAAMHFFDMLSEAEKDSKLLFLDGNEDGVLLGGFQQVFMSRLATFRNALHVFDNEPQIEEQLNRFKLTLDDKEVSYRFADSKTEPCIEISDVICGFLGKHFSFIEKNTIEELEVKKNHFNAVQLENLELLDALIDKADVECPCFIENSAPIDSAKKNEWFTHGEPFPDEYR